MLNISMVSTKAPVSCLKQLSFKNCRLPTGIGLVIRSDIVISRTHGGPLVRAFITNAGDPAGLYQCTPTELQDVEINPFLPVQGETVLLPSKEFCLYRLFY